MTARARFYNYNNHWDQVHSLQEAYTQETGQEETGATVRKFICRLPNAYKTAAPYKKLLDNGNLLQAFQKWLTEGDLDIEILNRASTNGEYTQDLTPNTPEKHPNVLWEELERKLEQIARDAETLHDPRFQTAITTAKRIAGSYLI